MPAPAPRIHGLLLLLLLAVAFMPVCARAAAPVTSVADSAALLERAESLIVQGQAAEALRQLRRLEQRFAGETRFDYLLALAALDAEQPALAIVALRRILAQEPRFDGARLDLARALAAAGDRESARLEYRRVVEESPSEVSRAAASRGLAALGAADKPTGWTAAVSAGAGFDSNANASTSAGEFFGFTLNSQSVAQRSAFLDAGAALQLDVPIGPVRVASALRFGHRAYPSARFIDQSGALGSIALLWPWRGWSLAGGVGGSMGWLDGRAHLRALNLEVSASRRVGLHWEIAALARAGLLDYRQSAFEEIDSRRLLWGGALQRLDLGRGRGRLGIALLGGRDTTSRRNSPWSNDRYGARIFGAWQWQPQTGLFAEVSWLTSDYFGARGFFGVDRLDRQAVATIGLDMRGQPAGVWSIQPLLRYTENPSNLRVFQFDRLELSVFVRREIR